MSANVLQLTKNLADAYFTGVFKLVLVTAAPTETQLDTFRYRAELLYVVSATGTYPYAGSAIAVTVGAVDATNNRVGVSFGDSPTWTGVNFTDVVGGWIYKDLGGSAQDELVQYVDFGLTRTVVDGSFGVTFSTPLYINR